MSKIISFKLNAKSIDKAIAEIKEYKAWMHRKAKELTERLAMLGMDVASVGFGTAMYDHDHDTDVTIEQTERGYKIVASGKDVMFLEFGSGVYYNGSEPYPEPRPEGVVGIGEYGKGHGKQDTWVYYKDGVKSKENKVFTHGNRAAMPMYYASQEMEEKLTKIAREVFSGE